MKKLILTTILAAILPVCLANAAQDNNNENPDGKPKQKQGGGCHKKDGPGKPGKKKRPEQDPKNNQ